MRSITPLIYFQRFQQLPPFVKDGAVLAFAFLACFAVDKFVDKGK